jgi:hypothetical protein
MDLKDNHGSLVSKIYKKKDLENLTLKGQIRMATDLKFCHICSFSPSDIVGEEIRNRSFVYFNWKRQTETQRSTTSTVFHHVSKYGYCECLYTTYIGLPVVNHMHFCTVCGRKAMRSPNRYQFRSLLVYTEEIRMGQYVTGV